MREETIHNDSVNFTEFKPFFAYFFMFVSQIRATVIIDSVFLISTALFIDM